MSSIKVSPVLSLEHAATMKIAISIWNHRIAHYDSSNVDDLFEPFQIHDSIPLPNILTSRLYECLDTLGKEIVGWIINHNIRIFPDREKQYLVPCLRHIVWQMEGTIDYDCTARKLLEVEYLSELEKFELAKGYFFLDYINETWPKLSNETVKECIQPLRVFDMMLAAGRLASREQLLKMHKKFETFLKWYFADIRRIIGFKYTRMEPFLDTPHEARVRIILHGLGYGVPIPA